MKLARGKIGFHCALPFTIQCVGINNIDRVEDVNGAFVDQMSLSVHQPFDRRFFRSVLETTYNGICDQGLNLGIGRKVAEPLSLPARSSPQKRVMKI